MTAASSASRPLAFALLAALLAASGCASMQPRVSGDVQSTLGYPDLARIRSANGLGAMTPDPTLEKAAAQQAGFMAETRRMKHTTARGRDFTARMHANGITTASAENVAHARAVEKVFEMWEKSPPHRRNMLDRRFSRYGLASAPDGTGRRYWALVLGR